MLDLGATMSAASKPVTADPTLRPKTLERRPEIHPPVTGGPEIEVPAGLSPEQREKIRLGALAEQVSEISRSIAFEVGDPRLIEAVERALQDRGLVHKGRNRPKKPSRLTVFLDRETRDTLNALAREQKKNRYFLVRDLLRPMLGLPPLPSKEQA
jgi:hypothetical protein